MLKEMIKKVSDWTLQKEEELAKECKIPMDTLDKQINSLKQKEEEIKNQLEEIEEIIQRLEKIKNTEMLRCGVKK